jgi:DNA-binding NarL/FixJ family response regulator
VRRLTERQFEVCKLMCQGMSGKEMAATLGCADQTVKRHTINVMKAFGAHSRSEVIFACFTEGIVDGSGRKPLSDSLTGQEKRLAIGLLHALSNKDLAAMHDLSVQTVKNGLRIVFDKCGVWSRAELMARYTV